MRVSSFAGFLDGYKSNNIASIESVLNYKIEEIVDIMNDLIPLLVPTEPELGSNLTRNINLLRQKNYNNILELLITFGESLKTNITLLNKVASEFDGPVKDKIRKIIYNFGEIAKLSEDRKLINIAIDLGSNFVY
jgi:hypothetical protein